MPDGYEVAIRKLCLCNQLDQLDQDVLRSSSLLAAWHIGVSSVMECDAECNMTSPSGAAVTIATDPKLSLAVCRRQICELL